MEHQELPAEELAERSVLGSAILKPPSFAEAKAVLAAEDFHAPANRAVFVAMEALAARGAPLDVIAIEDELRSNGQALKLEGGAGKYLVRLAEETATPENVLYHAGIVARRSALRRLGVISADVAKKADADPGEAQRLVLEAQKLLTQVQRGRARPGVDLADLIQPALDEFEARQVARTEGGGRLVGVSTGLTQLDYLTGGYRRGCLNILAARTSVGKTAYACQVALLNAVHEGIPALFFSLEMTPLELVERFFARLAKVDSSKLRTGELSVEDWQCLHFAGKQMNRQGLVTISTTRTLPGIMTEARAYRVKHPEEKVLFVVDYLQIVRTGERGRTREQEVAEVSAGLKELAVELEAPFLVPAQLNRGPEIEDREPRVSDIRDSGAIEQDADLVVLIVRKRDDVTGSCYAKVGKNRNGALGEAECQWHGATYELRDAEHPAQAPVDDGGYYT